QTGGPKQFASDFFIQVTRILHRVVQMNFTQPLESLSVGEPAEIESQTRLVVQAVKTAGRPFQVNAHFAVNVVPGPDRGSYVPPVLLAQRLHVLRSKLEAKPEH